MKRRNAIAKIMGAIDNELVLCNIGFPSRELYDIDDRNENFYMIGSMGLVSSIGLGLALAKPNKKIVIIDGDGSFLMNLGSVITIFAQNPSNLTWIVINNEAYGSTGNQETYQRMEEDMDFDAGRVLSGECTPEELTEELERLGEQTRNNKQQ